MAYEPTKDDKTMGMLPILLCIFTLWVAPLIIFLIKKDTSPFIKLHAKQALVWGVAINILLILTLIPFIGCVFWLAGVVLNLVFSIMGAVKVNKGQKFLYPLVSGWFCKDEIAAVYGDGGAAAPPATTV